MDAKDLGARMPGRHKNGVSMLIFAFFQQGFLLYTTQRNIKQRNKKDKDYEKSNRITENDNS